MQQNLFEQIIPDPPQIPGLLYITEFITPAAEQELITQIDSQPWLSELKRRVQHYGYKYDYKARNITPNLKLGDLPAWLQTYAAKLKEQNLFDKTPDQIIINEYQSGQGISPHIDCIPCFDKTIASLSLGSPCVMDFTNKTSGEKIPLLLEPRSLLLLSGDARYLWQHSIPNRKTDRLNGIATTRTRRISLTFRKIINIAPSPEIPTA